MSAWKVALWLLPLLVLGLASNGCGIDNCRRLATTEFESGVFLTAASEGSASTPLANRLDKTLTLDAAARTMVLEYDDADGNAVVENWTY